MRQQVITHHLYTAVGGDWYWLQRLTWSYEQWRSYLERAEVETWVAYVSGTPAGYFELETQAGGSVEITTFGLLPQFIGRGLGGALLTATVQRAWALGAPSDGGGQVRAARRVVRGAERLTHFVLGVARRSQGTVIYELAPINGETGLILRRDGRLISILAIDTDGTHILAVYNVQNPQKLRMVALPERHAP